jgi:hypothetical protein
MTYGAVRPQIKGVLSIMASAAGLRPAFVNHCSLLMLFLCYERGRMTFRAVKTHEFNMRFMAKYHVADAL